jgi:glycosyltransferase 2 family protein
LIVAHEGSASETEPDRNGAGFLKRHAGRLGASLVLALAFAWVLNRGGLPYLPPAGTLERVDAFDYAGFVVAMLFHMLTRHGRYHFLIASVARLPLRKIMTINLIGMAFITFLPFRLGEVARPAMLREKGHLSAWAVMGTVAAERILDGIVFSGVLLVGLGIAIPEEPLPERIGTLPISAAFVPQAAVIASIGFCAAFLVMASFYFYRTFARRVTLRLVGIASRPLAEKLADVVERVSDGLRFLVNFRHTIPYLAVTVVSVAGHVWAIQLLAKSVGLPELAFSEAMVVVGVLALGFAAPNAPGFFGSVQLALYAGMAVYVAPEHVIHEGATLVFLFYVTYLGLVVALAALAFAVDLASRRSS